MIPPLERFATNPIVRPSQITFARASGTFNPGATIDRASGRVILLVRVFEEETKRSCLALALSSDGERIEEIWDKPAITREASYEEWGVEDARITYLEADQLYAITYTGYSEKGPRVCLITTDDLLKPERYHRHGPRITGDNKNCVMLPQKVGGAYIVLHRPMPRIELIKVAALEDLWPAEGVPLVGPKPSTWRSSRVGSGAPPIATEIGWLFPFHGATSLEEGNVYSMGWCVLDLANPEKVLYVSPAPVLTPEAPYEIQQQPIPQVDMANFINGVRVVFPEGLVELGDDLLVYYGAADVAVGGARVNKRALIEGIKSEIALGHTASPL
jgi:beta-1,2-mannobiose phosphorylase / 1,2-beta-oligomannan phosphorylase